MALSDFRSLGARNRQPETMDHPDLDPDRHREALRALARINRISRTARRYWPEIGLLARRLGRHPVHLLDVACGGGDVAMALARIADRSGVDLRIDGCDLNSEALDHARRHAEREGSAVGFFQLDATDAPLPEYDVVISSLFLHHLDDDQAVDLLGRLARAARHLLQVSDLVRSSLGYAYAYAGSRLLTRSPVVHGDAVLSVAAAFTRAEAAGLARRAGLSGVEIRTSFPERFLLIWRRA